MSREVLAGDAEPTTGPERPSTRRRTFGARTVTRFTLLALVAAAATAALVGRSGGDGPDGGPGPDGGDRALQARLEPAPSTARTTPAADPATGPAADLDRLGLVLVLTNPGRTERAVDGIRVTGLGSVIDELAPGTLRVPGGGSVRVPITVTPDCALLDRGTPAVLVPGVDVVALQGDPRAVLAGLCPLPVPGLAVDVTAARASGTAGVDVRLVNHGGRTATVVAPVAAGARTRLLARPDLPLTLTPGQATTVTLTLAPTACPGLGPVPTGAAPDGSGLPQLEARMPQGYAPVGGWPVDLVRAAAVAAAASCGGR
jgi:hypothetical protein